MFFRTVRFIDTVFRNKLTNGDTKELQYGEDKVALAIDGIETVIKDFTDIKRTGTK
ncbi:MAG TPA: hypothetical protein VHR66_27910 [Gemmataceae bacterium]|nr:hypothetical protein [Gemmataceae bacterium]